MLFRSLPQPDLLDAEALLLKASQADCFPGEIKCLRAGKPVLPSSKLSTLTPEMDPAMGLIRVGGRFRRMDTSCSTDIHPIVLDPCHAVTRLLIKDMDARLLHPGPDRVFAEIRRKYWVLRGRQFIRGYLPSLQVRQKWHQPTDDLLQDTVVMIVDPQLPRAHWPVGKVVRLNASADGCIRSAEVQVGDKTYLRPVARLVRLPAVPDADADPGTSVAP